MKYTRHYRSLLSTTALAPGQYGKSRGSGADICMVDLEDSVPPWAKAQARELAGGYFAVPPAEGSRSAIRINAIDKPDGLRDLLALAEYADKPDIVVLPMVESPRDVVLADRWLADACPRTELLAVVETPQGVEDAAAIASASPRLRGLIFGAADYAFAMGAELTWESLLFARMRVVNGARSAAVEAMDAPLFDLSGKSDVRDEATRAQHIGFSGKVAIHPRQVADINTVFSPDQATIEMATRILAAARENRDGIAVIDGVMMGIPFYEASQRLVEEFGTPGGRGKFAETGIEK